MSFALENQARELTEKLQEAEREIERLKELVRIGARLSKAVLEEDSQ